MTTYRDDFDAAVRRADALEAELEHLRHERREDQAELRVKVTEFGQDLEAERERFAQLEAALRELAADAPSAPDGWQSDLDESRKRLAELDTAIHDLRALEKQARPRWSLRRKLAVAALAVVVWAAVAGGVYAALDHRAIQARRDEALSLLAGGNYSDYLAASRLLEGLVDQRPRDPQLLADASRVQALMALEFGGDEDPRVEVLINVAEAVGATGAELAPAWAARALHLGDLADADQVLTAAQAATGQDAAELIYLRGHWCLKQDRAADATRFFEAAGEAMPGDPRPKVALARALYLLGSHADALAALEEASSRAGDNVAILLLHADINIETGRDPGYGEVVARSVAREHAERASPGQLGWAELLQARGALLRDDRRAARERAAGAAERRPPMDPDFAARLAETYLALGEPTLARREAAAAVRLAPHLARHRLVLAEAELEAGSPDRAEEHLRVAGPSPRASLLLGRVLLARGDLEGAARRFQEAADGEREAPMAGLYLARNNLWQDDLGRLRTASSVWPSVRRPCPRPGRSSETYRRTGQLEAAAHALARAAAENPDDPDVAVALARLYAAQSRRAQALRAVQDALSMEPSHFFGLVILGELELEAGRLGEAEAALSRALEVRPEDWHALLPRARLATATGELDLARSLLHRAATAGAPPAQYLRARGELMVRRHESEAAVTFLERALEAEPDDAAAMTLLADALLLSRGGADARRAAQQYTAALAARPGFLPALVGQADAAGARGPNVVTERLIATARQALEEQGVTGPVAARLAAVEGRFLFDRGDSAGAREPLVEAVRLDSHLAEARLCLALVEEDLDNTGRACAHYREYLRLAPGGPPADVAEARRGQRETCR